MRVNSLVLRLLAEPWYEGMGWLVLTGIDAEEQSEGLQQTDHLVRLNVEPSNRHDKGGYSEHNLHRPVGRTVSTQEEEENYRDDHPCVCVCVCVCSDVRLCVLQRLPTERTRLTFEPHVPIMMRKAKRGSFPIYRSWKPPHPCVAISITIAMGTGEVTAK